jgi:hypothetical protein
MFGAILGNGVPSYDRVPPQQLSALRRGTPVRVSLAHTTRVLDCKLSPVADCSWQSSSPQLEGTYDGFSNGLIWVVAYGSDGRHAIGFDPALIGTIDIKSGTHWVTGAIVGGAIDAVVLVVAGVFYVARGVVPTR